MKDLATHIQQYAGNVAEDATAIAQGNGFEDFTERVERIRLLLRTMEALYVSLEGKV